MTCFGFAVLGWVGLAVSRGGNLARCSYIQSFLLDFMFDGHQNSFVVNGSILRTLVRVLTGKLTGATVIYIYAILRTYYTSETPMSRNC